MCVCVLQSGGVTDAMNLLVTFVGLGGEWKRKIVVHQYVVGFLV